MLQKGQVILLWLLALLQGLAALLLRFRAGHGRKWHIDVFLHRSWTRR